MAVLCALLWGGAQQATRGHSLGDAAVAASAPDATPVWLEAADQAGDRGGRTADGEQEDVETRSRTLTLRLFTARPHHGMFSRIDTYPPQFDLPPEPRAVRA